MSFKIVVYKLFFKHLQENIGTVFVFSRYLTALNKMRVYPYNFPRKA